MDFEQAIETQRHRLLRIVAGLVLTVGLLSVAPISRGFLDSACGIVASILSRAEAAAQYLVIAQARLIARRNGVAIDEARLLKRLAHVRTEDKSPLSLTACERRLMRLRGVLTELSQPAERLLRWIKKPMRRADRLARPVPDTSQDLFASVAERRPPATRIERPPDKRALPSRAPPVSPQRFIRDFWNLNQAAA